MNIHSIVRCKSINEVVIWSAGVDICGAIVIRKNSEEGWSPALIDAGNAVVTAESAAECLLIGSTPPESGIGSCREVQGHGLGPVLASWEVRASDQTILYLGSSGRTLHMLTGYFLGCQGMQGIMHVGRGHFNPLRAQPLLSISREEFLRRAGSY